MMRSETSTDVRGVYFWQGRPNAVHAWVEVNEAEANEAEANEAALSRLGEDLQARSSSAQPRARQRAVGPRGKREKKTTRQAGLSPADQTSDQRLCSKRKVIQKVSSMRRRPQAFDCYQMRTGARS